MLPLAHPDRIQIAPSMTAAWWPMLGAPSGQAQHLGLRASCGAIGKPGRQDADLVARWLAATALTTPIAFTHQGAIHPGDLPAQLPVGPRPCNGPGQPGVAGTGLVAAGAGPGDGPFTIDLDSTSARHTVWQGGGSRPRLHGQEGLSPEPGRGWTGDVLPPHRAAHFPAQPGAGPRSTPTPASACRRCASSTIRQAKPGNLIEPSRTGRPSPTGWRAPWPSYTEQARRRAGAAHRPRVKPTPGSQLALFATGTGGRPSATPRSRTPSETSRRGVEPSPLGPLPRQSPPSPHLADHRSGRAVTVRGFFSPPSGHFAVCCSALGKCRCP